MPTPPDGTSKKDKPAGEREAGSGDGGVLCEKPGSEHRPRDQTWYQTVGGRLAFAKDQDGVYLPLLRVVLFNIADSIFIRHNVALIKRPTAAQGVHPRVQVSVHRLKTNQGKKEERMEGGEAQGRVM